jgi:hypothetical protein
VGFGSEPLEKKQVPSFQGHKKESQAVAQGKQGQIPKSDIIHFVTWPCESGLQRELWVGKRAGLIRFRH